MATTFTYRYRHLAYIIFEAKTPLVIGSGEDSIVTDSLILKDANGLPYIPGTSLAGTLRHAIGEKNAVGFFGNKDQTPEGESSGLGSKIIFSEARLIGPNGKHGTLVMEGLQRVDWDHTFYRHFKNLPIRQHVRISHKGYVDGSGKYDEEVIYKGTRFCFSLETVSNEESTCELDSVLDTLYEDTYVIGAGSRSGFGKISVISIRKKSFDLTCRHDLDEYLETSSSLNADRTKWPSYTPSHDKQKASIKYEIELIPEDFFLFGSGKSDEESDMTPVKEDVIIWDDEGLPKFREAMTFMPGSSLKGTLSHRTAFWYNKTKKIFADEHFNLDEYVGKNNSAVREIFGSEGENGNDDIRGKALFSDIFVEEDVSEKILNHVAIDEYTGGAIDGALFSEKVSSTKISLKTVIFIDGIVDKEILTAFESALQDLCTGNLALGGGSNRGHGYFRGMIHKTEKSNIN